LFASSSLYDAKDLMKRQTETLFHTYSQFASAASIPAKPTEDEIQTEAKLQDILEKVRWGNHLTAP